MLIRYTGNVGEVSKRISAAVRLSRRRSAEFLKAEVKPISRHVNEVVDTHVYRVYKPSVYIRSYRLKESMTVTAVGDYEIVIDSDPAVAPAKSGAGGYPKYVAGVGPGIGFMKREHSFPREFHKRIIDSPSKAYGYLIKTLTERYRIMVFDKHFGGYKQRRSGIKVQ